MDFNKKHLVAASLLLLFIFSFAFLDIGLSSSNSSSDSSISASSAGDIDKRPDYDDIILYVDIEDGLDTRLKEEIVTALESRGFSVSVTDEISDDYGSPFAFVNIVDRNVLYTPVYSKSDIEIRFGFSSSGSTLYLDVAGTGENKPVVFRTDETSPYQLLVQGDVGMHDETKGLFSYRSYQKHIAQEAAKYIAEGLDSHIRDQN